MMARRGGFSLTPMHPAFFRAQMTNLDFPIEPRRFKLISHRTHVTYMVMVVLSEKVGGG